MKADIADDVIRKALESVEARERGEDTPDGSDAEPGQEATSGAQPGEAEAAAPEGEETETVESLRAQLELSQSKARETMERLKETHERLLRTAADLDNVRKRGQREKEEAQRFGIERLLRDLLPVVDNMERGLAFAPQSAEGQQEDPLATGVKMTLKLFRDVLAKHGVVGFDSVGQPFDPNVHEAMGQSPSSDVPANTVLVEHQRGYHIHERLLRPALVVVSTRPAEAPAESPKEPEQASAEKSDAAPEGDGESA
ncbi:MAG TPA: nucleotide exchange factor GrpE [Myxococcaceae bacterium]|nr:nucleotide exchange factor GrpE [Myxococcaceae bacterium]